PRGSSCFSSWMAELVCLALCFDLQARDFEPEPSADMPKPRTAFEQVIMLLERHYGRPEPPRVTSPLEMILHENVAYLVSDAQREAAFAALRSRVGTG